MKRKNYLFAVVGFVLANLSCESFLDRPPLDAIQTGDYWRTANDLGNYILQFYPKLPRHPLLSSMALEDEESDNLVLDIPNSVMNGQRTVTTATWSSEWTNIRDINIFFDQYRNVQDPFSTYRHFLGEAHFFKAWFYFDLMSRYGDVPWYTSALQPNSDELYKPRTPRTQVADSILSHLDKAIEYLDGRSIVGNTRLNKEAALAFKSRVALFEGTWQKYHAGTPYGTADASPNKYFQACIDASNELATGTGYVKGIYETGSPESDYYTLFGMDNMSAIDEVLLYSAANSAENMGNNVQVYTTQRAGAAGVTWQLVTSYLGKDGNPYDYLGLAEEVKGNDFLKQIAVDCDPRLHATVWIPNDLVVARNGTLFDKPDIDLGGQSLCPTGFQIKKFSNPHSRAAGLDQTGGFSETGYIIFRYAEVLLNLAEAQYELDQTVAYEVLNLLRRRAGMPDFSIGTQSDDPNRTDYGYPLTDELYEIRRERRVELALEGRRPQDYRRWAAHGLFTGRRLYGYPFAQAEFPSHQPMLEGNMLIDFFKTTLPDGYNFRADQDYLDDIPQVERTLNPNLTQNPGW